MRPEPTDTSVSANIRQRKRQREREESSPFTNSTLEAFLTRPRYVALATDVLQANPNNNMAAMYASVDLNAQPSVANHFVHSTSTIGLPEWEHEFLQGLLGNVTAMIIQTPTAVINAISTDFVSL